MTDGYPTGIAFGQALALLRATARPLPAMAAPLDAALGGVLAEDVVAPLDLQPFDNAAMDGFALRAADLAAAGETALRLVGEQFAGRAPGLRVGAGQCVRITTGAPMPEGADSVAIKENVRVDGERVFVPAGIARGANVRRRGEDVRAGDVVLQAGRVITPARVGILAALGLARIPLRRRPRVTLLSSGDELRTVGETLRDGEIFDSNGPMLRALLAAEGIAASASRLPDDADAVAAALRDAACDSDLILTCGGVSAGEKDHLPAVLAAHGEVVFWKVRIKPGLPLLFGRIGEALVLGLPGNPVSVLATFLALGRELIDTLQGRIEPRPACHARLASPLAKRHPRMEFQRARLEARVDGSLLAHPDPNTGSHRLSAAAQANALLVLPEGALALETGAIVRVLPYGDVRAE